MTDLNNTIDALFNQIVPTANTSESTVVTITPADEQPHEGPETAICEGCKKVAGTLSLAGYCSTECWDLDMHLDALDLLPDDEQPETAICKNCDDVVLAGTLGVSGICEECWDGDGSDEPAEPVGLTEEKARDALARVPSVSMAPEAEAVASPLKDYDFIAFNMLPEPYRNAFERALPTQCYPIGADRAALHDDWTFGELPEGCFAVTSRGNLRLVVKQGKQTRTLRPGAEGGAWVSGNEKTSAKCRPLNDVVPYIIQSAYDSLSKKDRARILNRDKHRGALNSGPIAHPEDFVGLDDEDAYCPKEEVVAPAMKCDTSLHELQSLVECQRSEIDALTEKVDRLEVTVHEMEYRLNAQENLIAGLDNNRRATADLLRSLRDALHGAL